MQIKKGGKRRKKISSDGKDQNGDTVDRARTTRDPRQKFGEKK